MNKKRSIFALPENTFFVPALNPKLRKWLFKIFDFKIFSIRPKRTKLRLRTGTKEGVSGT